MHGRWFLQETPFPWHVTIHVVLGDLANSAAHCKNLQLATIISVCHTSTNQTWNNFWYQLLLEASHIWNLWICEMLPTVLSEVVPTGFYFLLNLSTPRRINHLGRQPVFNLTELAFSLWETFLTSRELQTHPFPMGFQVVQAEKFYMVQKVIWPTESSHSRSKFLGGGGAVR